MLITNDLVEYKLPMQRIVRILWLHPEQPYAAVYETGKKDGFPELVEIGKIEEDLENGTATLLLKDPYQGFFDETETPEIYRKKRDRDWEIIQEILQHVPAIFHRKKRGEIVRAASKKWGVKHTKIYTCMRRFWERGQTPSALMPDYAKCGGKGKSPTLTPGIKLGRPRKYGDQVGLNVSEEMKRIFRVATSRFYLSSSRFSLKSAYDRMIKDFFLKKNTEEENKRRSYSREKDNFEIEIPSIAQYKYWMNKEESRPNIKRKKLGDKIYDLNLRGLLSTSNLEVWGPAARYQIDATIADVYLVSRLNRKLIIGRPVLYIVTDVFSRMVVGMYVGLEGPSWVGAMMALANTATEKKAFCKEFGIEIDLEDWPCHFMSASILGDRGELESHASTALANNFFVKVENTAPYRADWKGIVERRFLLLPAKFNEKTPGYIDTDFRQRGGTDYRLDAVLDLHQFTQIIIECILLYNNQHQLIEYDKEMDFNEEGAAAVPLDLWNWGIENRSGSLRKFPPDLVKFGLMPTDQATVTERGIRWKGNFYICELAVNELWFDKARQEGDWKVKISFDPRSTDQIYLHDSSRKFKFEVCHITEHSRAYKGVSLWEVQAQKETEKHVTANRQLLELVAEADLSKNIDDIISKAKSMAPIVQDESAASRTRSIRENRKAEKNHARLTESFDLSAQRDATIEIRNQKRHSIDVDDYDEPTTEELFFSKGIEE